MAKEERKEKRSRRSPSRRRPKQEVRPREACNRVSISHRCPRWVVEYPSTQLFTKNLEWPLCRQTDTCRRSWDSKTKRCHTNSSTSLNDRGTQGQWLKSWNALRKRDQNHTNSIHGRANPSVWTPSKSNFSKTCYAVIAGKEGLESSHWSYQWPTQRRIFRKTEKRRFLCRANVIEET